MCIDRYNAHHSGGLIPPEMIFNIQIWRVGDVAKFLGCTEGHIYNLVSQEKIPKVKKGKFLYFVPDEIRNWILEGDYK